MPFSLWDAFSVRSNVQFNFQITYPQIATASLFNYRMGCFLIHSKAVTFCFYQVKQAEVLSKKKEERNKHFVPPKEKPLMKTSTEGKDESEGGREWCHTAV